MTAHELKTVTTPLLLFVEHDTPLTKDWPVADLIKPLLGHEADLVRMNYDYRLHPDHAHLLVDEETTVMHGLPYRRTLQWSQRPHLARVDKYRQWLADWFEPGERFMIEDRLHSVVQRYPWGRFKIFMYTPDGDMQRSIHRDARAGDVKWDA